MSSLNLKSLDDVRALLLDDLPCGVLQRDQFEEIGHLVAGFWMHDGDMSRPHVKLSGGDCSSGYINIGRFMRYPNLREILAWQIGALVRRHIQSRVDWVVGSDHGSAPLVLELSGLFGCSGDFLEKKEDSSTGRAVQVWRRHDVTPQEKVLIAEELVTGGGTSRAVIDGLLRGDVNKSSIPPFIATLIYRPTLPEKMSERDDIVFIEALKQDVQILYWQRYDFATWEKGRKCALCKAGSRTVGEPKSQSEWFRLTMGF